MATVGEPIASGDECLLLNGGQAVGDVHQQRGPSAAVAGGEHPSELSRPYLGRESDSPRLGSGGRRHAVQGALGEVSQERAEVAGFRGQA